ncbi:MAG: molybdopterin-dependent oxidoreductase [Rhodospirillales bacterium]|nr:molybdopterin-dependent oxidoreductase [Rhodospirillales bacterium]
MARIPNPFETVKEQVDTAPVVADEVKNTTCYMCACRCGIRVHLKDNKVRYIEGNPDHPVNKGVLCAKGAAGIMHINSPARLTKPLKRVGPRGSGEFKEIEWDEALDIANAWLARCRATNPRKLAFFTGRDQSQSLTSWWAEKFGTPNYSAHGGFCSANMAAGGLYTIGSAFWEFSEPDWDRTKYFMMFGVAEDHDSNPIKAGLGKLKTRGDVKFISVNPVRTGYSAIADEWISIRPGTDGLFVMALIHELLKADRIDTDYLVRYTNAPWLVVQNEGGPDHGLFVRDADNNAMCWDTEQLQPVSANRVDIQPSLVGVITLPDGRKAVPSFQIMVERYLDERYAPDAVAETTGVPADTIRRIAAELANIAFEETIELDIEWTDWAGRKHDTVIGRPVSMHAMRGISAHSNGFHTCRAIHILQLLLGSIDVPGGMRYKPPYPKALYSLPKPTGHKGDITPNSPMRGPHLGFPMSPEDLLVDDDGQPQRIDKAFSWDAPLAIHGLMHMVIHNAWKGDPYPIDTLFFYMSNMAWNSSMNTAETMDMLTDKDPETGEYRIPRIICSDAFHSEMVAYSDLVLPDTTYLERWDCISLLDRPISHADGAADAIRHPVLEPDRDVRPFQDVLLDLGARLGLDGMMNEDGKPTYPKGYRDYITNHQRRPGIGPLAGWRGADGSKHGRGEPNPDQLERYIENQSFWEYELPDAHKYYRMANKGYLEWACEMGFVTNPDQIIFKIYSEALQTFRLAAQGHGAIQPPDIHRDRIETFFDPLPIWYMPLEEAAVDSDEFPLHAITQRPMHMYHSWGSQNAWLRQITSQNHLYINKDTAAELGIADGDWVWVIGHHGRVKGPARLLSGTNRDTVWTWNAIGKRRGAWGLDKNAPEGTKGFLLNHIISELLPDGGGGYRYSNSDPVTGQAAWYDLRVRVEKCLPEEAGETAPAFALLPGLPGQENPPEVLRYGHDLKGQPSGLSSVEHREWIANRQADKETPKPNDEGMK